MYTNKITKPKESFMMHITGKSRIALKDTLSMYLHLIQEVGLKQKQFDIIQPKLTKVKYIADTLQCNFIMESYDKMIKTIEEYIEERLT